MAAPTPNLERRVPRWSTSLAGRKVRPAMMTKVDFLLKLVEHRPTRWQRTPRDPQSSPMTQTPRSCPRMLRNCGVSSDLVIRPTLGATEHEILTADLRLAE
jgi:hypothetical protein